MREGGRGGGGAQWDEMIDSSLRIVKSASPGWDYNIQTYILCIYLIAKVFLKKNNNNKKNTQTFSTVSGSLLPCLIKASQINRANTRAKTSQVIHVHECIHHYCIIVTPSSHWVAPAKTWRWRIITTWIREIKAKKSAMELPRFCSVFVLLLPQKRISSALQSSPSLNYSILNKTWLLLPQPPKSHMECPAHARTSSVKGWNGGTVIDLKVCTHYGGYYSHLGQPQRCVMLQSPFSLPSANGAGCCRSPRVSPPHHCSHRGKLWLSIITPVVHD